MRSSARVAASVGPPSDDLSPEQMATLREVASGKPVTADRAAVLGRLVSGLVEMRRGMRGGKHMAANSAIRHALAWVDRLGCPWWTWSAADWRAAAGALRVRQVGLVFAYFQYASGCALTEVFDEPIQRHKVVGLARAAFGEDFERLYESLVAALAANGYGAANFNMRAMLARAVLAKRGTSFVPDDLEAVLRPVVAATRRGNRHQGALYVARGLHLIGQLDAHFPPLGADGEDRTWVRGSEGVPDEWMRWVGRYMDVLLCEENTRKHRHSTLVRIGRWMHREHGVSSPEQITPAIAAAFNAAVARAKAGDFSLAGGAGRRSGTPFAPHTRLLYLSAIRHFVETLVEAEMLPLRMLASARLLRPPKALRRQLEADPRDIDPVVFAKLLAAALTLRPQDVPDRYPFEFWVALAAVWLWSALRKDEIRRLRTDCVRDFGAWRSDGGEKPKLCWLEIPRNKTGSVYTKPVPIEVGEAVRAWLAVRPAGQFAVDRKTGRPVEMLFMLRGKMVGSAAINNILIPLLCRRAGIPRRDSRGPITSHRARATIATALHNADHPMSLFDLKEYLGHADFRSTKHYVRQSPRRMAERYAHAMDAVGRVDVLVDRDAVVSGAAARGEAWIYHAVPGGLCSNDAYAACPHRMACEPKCSFHVSDDGERARLLEASHEVRRYVAQLDLDAGEEAAATPEGLRRLRRRLRDVPVPGGPTPRELRGRAK